MISDATQSDADFLRFLVSMTRKPDSSRIKAWLDNPNLAGTFAVRPSSSGRKDQLAISVRFEQLHQERIQVDWSGCTLLGQPFGCVYEAIKYFRSNPIGKRGSLGHMSHHGDKYIIQAGASMGEIVDGLQAAGDQFTLATVLPDDVFDRLAQAAVSHAAKTCNVADNDLSAAWCKALWYGPAGRSLASHV